MSTIQIIHRMLSLTAKNLGEKIFSGNTKNKGIFIRSVLSLNNHKL
jgi:hypothetical protein